MVFPLIPIILVAGTAISVALQAKDSFSSPPVNTVLVSRQTQRQGSQLTTGQIAGIPIYVILIGIIILFLVILK